MLLGPANFSAKQPKITQIFLCWVGVLRPIIELSLDKLKIFDNFNTDSCKKNIQTIILYRNKKIKISNLRFRDYKLKIMKLHLRLIIIKLIYALILTNTF